MLKEELIRLGTIKPSKGKAAAAPPPKRKDIYYASKDFHDSHQTLRIYNETTFTVHHDAL